MLRIRPQRNNLQYYTIDPNKTGISENPFGPYYSNTNSVGSERLSTKDRYMTMSSLPWCNPPLNHLPQCYEQKIKFGN